MAQSTCLGLLVGALPATSTADHAQRRHPHQYKYIHMYMYTISSIKKRHNHHPSTPLLVFETTKPPPPKKWRKWKINNMSKEKKEKF